MNLVARQKRKSVKRILFYLFTSDDKNEMNESFANKASGIMAGEQHRNNACDNNVCGNAAAPYSTRRER